MPLTPNPPTNLKPKEWVSVAHVGMQDFTLKFLLISYGALIFLTMLIYFFQGFRLAGFSLPTDILKWLGGATVGEIAGLLAITFKGINRP